MSDKYPVLRIALDWVMEEDAIIKGFVKRYVARAALKKGEKP